MIEGEASFPLRNLEVLVFGKDDFLEKIREALLFECIGFDEIPRENKLYDIIFSDESLISSLQKYAGGKTIFILRKPFFTPDKPCKGRKYMNIVTFDSKRQE